MNALSLHDLYERWAPLYHAEPHNPLMQAEQSAMLARLPKLDACSALDLACGSGRYSRVLAERGAAYIAALDFSAAMLHRVTAGMPVQGDLTALPFRDCSFDLVISGLALGHARDLDACMREIARVLKPGGALLYSDFHPEAQRRGHRRSFRDAAGVVMALPPGKFEQRHHLAALAAAGLMIDELFEPQTGQDGVPWLLVVGAHRP